MPTVTVKTKPFKTMLKTFKDLNRKSERATVLVFNIDSENKFNVSLRTDVLTANAELQTESVSLEPEGVGTYLFSPEHLLKIPFNSDTISLTWTSERSPLVVSYGKISTALRIAVGSDSLDKPDFPKDVPLVEVSIGLLYAIVKYLSLPFAYFKTASKDTMPIQFKNQDGFLVALSEDGYSLAKIKTKIALAEPLDVKIPRYLLETLYGRFNSKETMPAKFGSKGFMAFMTDGVISISSTTVNDRVSDIDEALKSQTWKSTCEFEPSKLEKCLETLVNMIPDKDRSGAVVRVALSDKMNLDVSHKEVGDGTVEGVEGVSNIYNEQAVKEFVSSQHPVAFSEYTTLLGGLDIANGLMHMSNRTTLFKGTDSRHDFDVTYLFPAVLG